MAARIYLDTKPYSRLVVVLLIIAIMGKSILAAITSSSSDFINIASSAVFAPYPVSFYGPYTFSVYFMNLFYRLWLLIPVDHQWIYSGGEFLPSPSGFLLIFIFKLPLLVLDVVTSLLIYQIVLLIGGSRRIGTFAALIWLLNPYLTIAIEMDGTIDIVSTFLVVLATYLFLRCKHVLSAICLGLATVARFYPVALIPFYALFLLKEGKVRSFGFMIASYCAVLILVLAPFISSYGVGFLSIIYELPAGGNKEFLWFFGFRPNVSSTSGTEISSVATVLVVVTLLALKVWRNDRRLVLDMILIVLVTYVGLSHWNRYYTIWVTPFLTIDMAINRNSRYRTGFMALYALFFLSAFVYNSIYWWFSSLLFLYEFTPEISAMAACVREIAGTLRAGDLGTTFSQSILAGTCILYAAMVVKRNLIRIDGQGSSGCYP